MSSLNPDVVCLTEAYEDSLNELGGHSISIPGVTWSPTKEGERKVVLWSKNPWVEVDGEGNVETQSGAYLSAVTETGLGLIRFVGICMPYHMAAPIGVSPKPKMWSQHLIFLDGLAKLLPKGENSPPTILLGDFNQRIPRVWTPKKVYQALLKVIDGYEVATEGKIKSVGELTIDHIVHSKDFKATRITSIDNYSSDGSRLSDHFGIYAEL